jgi:hypothetical protein
MTLLITVITITDTLVTTSKIMATSELIRQEVIRNNYLSSEAGTVFDLMLYDAVSRSTTFRRADIDQPAINGAPKQYGEIENIRISARYAVFAWFLGESIDDGTADYRATATVFRMSSPELTMNWEYRVPCLRYIK